VSLDAGYICALAALQKVLPHWSCEARAALVDSGLTSGVAYLARIGHPSVSLPESDSAMVAEYARAAKEGLERGRRHAAYSGLGEDGQRVPASAYGVGGPSGLTAAGLYHGVRAVWDGRFVRAEYRDEPSGHPEVRLLWGPSGYEGHEILSVAP
jgi:hypothetical protein